MGSRPTSSRETPGTAPKRIKRFIITFALFLSAYPGGPQAQCIDYPDYLHLVGGVASVEDRWSSDLTDLASLVLSGDRGYLLQSWGDDDWDSCKGVGFHARLKVVSLDDPTSPQILGAGSVWYGKAGGLAVAGDYAYVSAFGYRGVFPNAVPEYRLRVIDVGNSAAPQQVASRPWDLTAPPPYPAPAIAVSDDHAYLAADDLGLVVIDITDPLDPQVQGSVAISGAYNWFPFGDLAIAGRYAYLAMGCLEIIDVSDPWAPVVVGSLPGMGYSSVSVVGTYLFLGGFGSELTVLDISDPTTPQIVGNLTVPCGALDIAIAENRAYVTGFSGGWGRGDPGCDTFSVIDISDPTSPHLLGGSPVPAARPGFTRLEARGGLVYLASRSGLDVFEIATSEYAPVSSHVALNDGGLDVAVAGDLAYLTDCAWGAGPHQSHLRLVDVRDAGNAHVVGEVTVPGAWSVAATPGWDYVHVGAGYGFSGVREVYVGDPASPQVRGGVDLPSPVSDVVAVSPLVWAAAGQLYAIDASDPDSPLVIGSIDTPGDAGRLALAGELAYVADGAAGLQIVNVSDPTAPHIVGALDIPGCPNARGVTVAGAYAYVTTGEWTQSGGGSCSRLHKIDISDPTSPLLVGSASTRGTAWELTANGDHVYVAGGGGLLRSWRSAEPGLLHVFEVSDGVVPRLVGSGRTTFGSVAAAGDLILAPTPPLRFNDRFEPGLAIYPVQCEPTPVLLSGITATPQNGAVVISWATSFESRHDGFNVYRSDLLESGYARLNDHVIRGRSPYSYVDHAVAPATTYFYKVGAVDVAGHEVLYGPASVTTPAWGTRTELHLASPSPFGKETVLQFTLVAPAPTRLAVYDVAGRSVRVLVKEELPVGDHDVTWDGRDDAGLRVAGGTYFVKFTAGEVAQTRKVVFLGGK